MLGHRVEQNIQNRRRKEEIARDLERKVKENESIALQVKFMEQSNISAKVSDHLVKQGELREKALSNRRERLRHLLESEDQRNKAVLMSQQETIEHRRARIAEEEEEERKVRESERKKLADEKLDQKWRASMDEVRQANSKLLEKEAQAVLIEQMAEKQRRAETSCEEGKVFEALWQEDYQKKVDRERGDMMLREQRSLGIKKALHEQIEEKRKKEEGCRQESEDYGINFGTWTERKRENVDLKALEAAVAIRRNRAEEEKRVERKEVERFVACALEEERKRLEEERAARMRNSQEMNKFIRENRVERDDKAKFEAFLEEAYAQEAERQNEELALKRQREEAARQELLEKVYSERAGQVAKKIGKIEQLKQQWKEEGKSVANLARAEEEANERAKLKCMQEKLEYKKQLLEQMREKDQRKVQETKRIWEEKQEEERQHEKEKERIKAATLCSL